MKQMVVPDNAVMEEDGEETDVARGGEDHAEERRVVTIGVEEGELGVFITCDKVDCESEEASEEVADDWDVL